MRINANQTLRISLAAATVLLLFAESSFAAQTYEVRKGETLYQIAKKFSTTVSALSEANSLSAGHSIKPGQVLTISTDTPAQTQSTTFGCSKMNGVEVKSGDRVIDLLSKGEKIPILSREGAGFNVKLLDGRTGWVSAESVTLQETRKPLPVADSWSLKSDVVRKAYSYRGARYRSGGMSSRGFDCSGFVAYVYATTKGIKLPHSSRAQFRCGTPVSKSELLPGDMVFFNYRGRGVSHVGLYTGNGKFIHASTRRTGVRVDSLNSSSYSRRFVGARRL